MTITFENDNNVIVYALENILAYARSTQQIFVAQCIWWLASIRGLEQGLISYIDNVRTRTKITVTTEALRDTSEQAATDTIELRQDQVLKECEEYLKESRRLRDIASLKSKGTTQTGLINPIPISKKLLKKSERVFRKRSERSLRKRQRNPEEYSQTKRIDEGEISRRKAAGECLRCAWPSNRKGNHRVKDCRRQIMLDKGTPGFPKAKEYQWGDLQETVEGSDKDSSVAESSYDDSL